MLAIKRILLEAADHCEGPDDLGYRILVDVFCRAAGTIGGHRPGCLHTAVKEFWNEEKHE